MDLKELMSTTPQSLAKVQKAQLKKHVIEILRTVMQHIEHDNYDILEDMIRFSRAGDGYGNDNYYIDFSYGNGEMDINDVIDILRKLDKLEGDEE